MQNIFYIISAAAGAILALAIYIVVRRIVLKGRKEEIIQKAEIEAEGIKKEKIFQAKEKFLQLKSEHEQYINERNAQIRETESRLKQKENTLNQQNSELTRKQKEADAIRESLKTQVEIAKTKSEEYESLKQEAIKQIENIAGMTAAEAKAQLVENMKAEARSQAQSYINDVMDEARLTASKEAKRIVINTIQRTASETAIENAVTVFHIESDEIKGRIIGREGRNIRALEAATGDERVVDDTPESILLSAFDPVRREVARLALHQLVIDGVAGVRTCQLQMGVTELKEGSVWNTMPAHTHLRRMETYFYYNVPEGQKILHVMGEPQETRPIWLNNEEAVIAPEWSIHCAAGTSNYTFIWGMAGENLIYNDMQVVKIPELK